MTVSSTTSRSGPYTGNGVTTVFAYGFRILDETHVEVVRTEAGVDETVSPSEFTVSGVGNAVGGNITFTLAPTSAQTITIIRAAPFTQAVDLENQGAYYAETIEEAFDLAAMRDQQLQEQVDRSVKIPVGADASTLGALISDVIRLADSADEIDTVAGISADVATVAGVSADVTTVAGIAADVSSVAAVDAEVVAVAAVDAEVAAVAGIAANVTTAAGIAADVTTVAGISADVTTVAGLTAEIAALPGQITDAQDAAAAAEAAYDAFDDRYLGAKAVAPTLDNDGNALLVGAVYWDTVSDQMFTWSGSEWLPTFLTGNTVRSLVVATAGQTVVTTPTYRPGMNTLSVFVNGIKMLLTEDYAETDQNTITFTSGLAVSDEVELIAVQSLVVGSYQGQNYATRAAFVANTGYTPADGTIATAGGHSYVRTTGATAIPDLLGWLPFGDVYVEHFGAVGDGSTSDTAAFQAAVSFARRVHLRQNTNYLLGGAGSSLVTAASGCALIGSVGSRISLSGSASFYVGFICTAGDFSAEDIEFRVVQGGAVGVAIWRPGGSRIRAYRCRFDGGTVYTGLTPNWPSFGLQITNDSGGSDWDFEECVFTRMLYPVLKANEITSTQLNIKFERNLFTANYLEDLGFNAPNSFMENITVVDNVFEGNLGVSIGLPDSLHLTFASVKNFTVRGNIFNGSIRESIHIEEDCRDFIVDGNIGICDYDEDGAGVAILRNDIAAEAAPQRGIISNNRFRHFGGTKTNRFGIWLVNDGTGLNSGREILVQGNTVEGFGFGFSAFNRSDVGNQFKNNIALDCSVGYQDNGGVDTFFGNLSRNCAVGVRGETGGQFFDHVFDNCTAIAGLTSTYPILLQDAVFLIASFAHSGASATIFRDVVPLTNTTHRAAARISGMSIAENVLNASAARVADITFDGTTFGNTSVMNRSIGAFDIVFDRSGGNLRAGVFSATARDSVRVTVKTNGTILLGGA